MSVSMSAHPLELAWDSPWDLLELGSGIELPEVSVSFLVDWRDELSVVLLDVL